MHWPVQVPTIQSRFGMWLLGNVVTHWNITLTRLLFISLNRLMTYFNDGFPLEKHSSLQYHVLFILFKLITLYFFPTLSILWW